MAELETVDLVFRGDDITFNVTVDGQDVTGWTFEFGMWGRERDIDPDGVEDAVLTSDDITITNAAAGEVSIVLASADVAALTGNKKYPFRFRRTNTGFRGTLTYGTIKIHF